MKRWLIIAAIATAALVTLGMRSWFKRDTTLTASGTLEARNVNVGSKVGGRVEKVNAQEGDRVQAGQVILTFEDSELNARLLSARGRYEQAKANYEKMLHGSRPEDIQEARGTAEYQQHFADTYRADVERAKADLDNAAANFHRAQQLASHDVVSRQYLDDAENRYKAAQATLASYQNALVASQGTIAAADAAKKRAERGSRPEDIAMAKAQMISAEGDLREAESQWNEREVKAPANAVVEAMDIRPGDLLPANTSVAKLLESDQLFVVVYVPQSMIGRVHLGQDADVRVDAFDRPFRGKVEQIRQQAEFLPRNVETKDEREHQVVGVKLRVDNPEGRLRAGIHADVKFLEKQ
ncbi:MAG: HlyD family efflux transporter periplasmic adaptor subunit [Acidobacteria bacterium]|nr:HlyD family efflux transporter periplasmic adaptor subunit [Acidobacteriota bacterium]MBV9148204.1 HlyD family efflux transporter periplasmic adaptor subunit [Acidobacteriota bacterium]MBV9435694.1 HlyD family efflux transporter periplasmic adaptor subunit [Acidobacteriota bacterium]